MRSTLPEIEWRRRAAAAAAEVGVEGMYGSVKWRWRRRKIPRGSAQDGDDLLMTWQWDLAGDAYTWQTTLAMIIWQETRSS